MITAEDAQGSGIKIKISEHTSQALPDNLGSYYNEFLIVNYLDVDIHAVDYQNKTVRIKKDPLPLEARFRKVEIWCRHYAGDRKYDQYHRYETTPSKHVVITIPYDIIREQPIFVEELNAVLCFGDQIDIAQHPHSKEAVAERTHHIQIETARRHCATAPFVMIANDPTGRIKELYIEVGGSICATRITHFPNEIDAVTIGLRNKEHSADEYTTYRTTFTELFTRDEKVWRMGAFRFSSNRSWFEHVLAVERSKTPEFITIEAVDDLIKQARIADVDMIRHLSEENKEAKRRTGVIEAAYAELKDGDYQEKKAEYDYNKLELEREKLRRATAEADHKLASERLKMKQEIITTVGTVAKTLAVMVPVGIGIYKAVKAYRTAS